MGNRIRIIVIAAAACLLLWSAAPVTQAELSIEEMRQLLQESLTITEIDREVRRLTEEEKRLAEEIDKTKQFAAKQETLVGSTREHAAKVLRAYYMGDRDRMWLLLLHTDSFADALAVYQYLMVIVDADRRSLDRYLASYRELKALQAQLEQTNEELRTIKSRFLAERVRLVALQQELDAKLEQAENREQILEQMDALSRDWYDQGLPLFRRFLQAMAAAMQQLPDYIAAYDDSLDVDGDNYTFLIRDDQLNMFLQSKNAIFEHYVYTINEKGIFIDGEQSGVQIAVHGHYGIESEPENALRFKLDELSYNGFALPDTTREDMQRQFNMTFYPKRYSSSLEATDVELGPGELRIRLRFSPGN